MKLQKRSSHDPSVKFGLVFNNTGARVVINPKNPQEYLVAKNALYCPDVAHVSNFPTKYWKKVDGKVAIMNKNEQQAVDHWIKHFGEDLNRDLEFYDQFELYELSGAKRDDSVWVDPNKDIKTPIAIKTRNYWLHFWILLMIVLGTVILYITN